ELWGPLDSSDQVTFWTASSSKPSEPDTTKLEFATRDEGVNDEEDNQAKVQLYRKAGGWSPFYLHLGELLVATDEEFLITRDEAPEEEPEEPEEESVTIEAPTAVATASGVA